MRGEMEEVEDEDNDGTVSNVVFATKCGELFDVAFEVAFGEA